MDHEKLKKIYPGHSEIEGHEFHACFEHAKECKSYSNHINITIDIKLTCSIETHNKHYNFAPAGRPMLASSHGLCKRQAVKAL
jgi:hypothetical protein